MKSHKATKENKPTHTRIGDKKTIYGGSYHIPDDELNQFYELYYNAIVAGNVTEHLTEKQNIGDDNSVLYIDFDFRHDVNVTERQFNTEFVCDLTNLVIDTVLSVTCGGCDLKAFVMMKDNVNVCPDKGYTKDGIHIATNLIMPRHIQLHLRQLLMKDTTFVELCESANITNDMESIYDDGITKGTVNTQLYGSCKPHHEAYKIVAVASIDEEGDIEFSEDCEVDYNTFKTVCVKTTEHKVKVDYIHIEKPKVKKSSRKVKKLIITGDECDVITSDIDPSKIADAKQLGLAYKSIQTQTTDKIMSFLNALPEAYANDYGLWIKVGWALKCENEMYFILWIIFSSQSTKFDFIDVAGYYEKWTDEFLSLEQANCKYERGGLTFASIADWVKESNPDEFKKLVIQYGEQDEPVMSIKTLCCLKSTLHEERIKELSNNFKDFNKDKQKAISAEIEELQKEQEEETMKMKKEYFEKYHFKVMSPVCFGRIAYNKTSLMRPIDLTTSYENVTVNSGKRFTDEWRKETFIRSFENVDFLPYPRPCPKHTMNTFNGLAAEKMTPSLGTSDIDIFLNHMRILTGKEEDGFNYLLNYLAHLVQRPGEPPRTSLVFQSDQGVGKNLFFEFFGNVILGKEYILQTAEMEKVIGRFSMINNKLMVIMDETQGKDSFSNSEKIKNIITADYIAWERKGIDGININNCGRYLIFSNNNTPVKIEMSDRRFVVYKCSNDVRNNTAYFKDLIKAFKDVERVRTFYEYLMNLDISEWDSINDRPITKAYKSIQSANIPVVARFLDYLLNDYVEVCPDILKNGMIKMCSKRMFQLFGSFCGENRYKHDYTQNKFAREINEFDGIDKKRFTGGGRGYLINEAEIRSYLTSRGLMEVIECVDMKLNDDDDEIDAE